MTKQDCIIILIFYHFSLQMNIFLFEYYRRLMRRHGSSQSQCSNQSQSISLLDEIAESFHTGIINQGTVSSLPLPVPEVDAESNLEDER